MVKWERCKKDRICFFLAGQLGTFFGIMMIRQMTTSYTLLISLCWSSIFGVYCWTDPQLLRFSNWHSDTFQVRIPVLEECTQLFIMKTSVVPNCCAGIVRIGVSPFREMLSLIALTSMVLISRKASCLSGTVWIHWSYVNLHVSNHWECTSLDCTCQNRWVSSLDLLCQDFTGTCTAWAPFNFARIPPVDSPQL